MNINALIKFSSRYPQGEISQATFEYLSSMAHLEADHNARIAFLSERGARVASEPSQYWQRALSVYKYARQGADPTHYLDLLSQKEVGFSAEGSDESLLRLASENEGLAQMLRVADAETKSELKKDQRMSQRGRDQKSQKATGAKEQKALERKEKGKSGRALLNRYKAMLLDPKTSSGMKTKIFKNVYAMIGKKSKALKVQREDAQIAWTKRKNEPIEVEYKGANGKTLVKKTKIDNTREWESIQHSELKSKYKAIWDKEYGAFIGTIFNLAKRTFDGGGAAKKEDGAPKSEGASETTTKSEGSKGEEKGIVESLMESENISKEEAVAMAGNILGEGDEEEPKEETPETPTDGGSAQEAVTEVGLGDTLKKKSRKQKKFEAKGGQGNWKDNKKSIKASEEGFSFSDFDSDTDFDIVF